MYQCIRRSVHAWIGTYTLSVTRYTALLVDCVSFNERNSKVTFGHRIFLHTRLAVKGFSGFGAWTAL